jgi:hypothetical protein
MLNTQQQYLLANVKHAFNAIGYHKDWMRDSYKFADLYSLNIPEQEIALGIFGQEPLDYRSACFGLEFDSSRETAENVLNRMRALGAPQLFYVGDNTTQRWQIHADRVSLAETVPTHQLENFIRDHKQEWNPQAVLRAKAGFVPLGPQQLDFIDLGLLPALEHEASKKIDRLVHQACSLAENYYEERGLQLNVSNLFSLVFQLLVGKLLLDRGIPTSPKIDFADADTVLKAVRNHYPSEDHQSLKNSDLPTSILQKISLEIASSFSFANLSAETLTYVYENTFVSAPSRKSLGIHSTPSYLADYILSQLPLEGLERDKWNVWDPTCGHGIFLIAAMRRMRNLLPEDWSGKERHQFFSKRLHGIDIEKFSIEVAKLCLMLADFPEANGWDLINQDVFSGSLLEERAKTATIIVGNPPFEAMENKKPLVRKPAELLSRVLPNMANEAMLGMVLPRAFLDGSDYRKEREILLRDFDFINITELPDRIFSHSEVETSIVIAKKTKEKSSFFLYRGVQDKDRINFQSNLKATWEEKVSDSYLLTSRNNTIAVPRLLEVWQSLASRPTLAQLATIKTGIRYKLLKHNPDLARTLHSQPGNSLKKGIDVVTSSFMQYTAEGQKYFSMEPEQHQNKAYLYKWDQEKVIVPASRNSRGSWRYAAAYDNSGLCVSRRFYAIWPKSPDLIPAKVITALLNSPVAMAYVSTHASQKDIPVSVYESIPLPSKDSIEQAKDKIIGLVDKYIALTSAELFIEDEVKSILLEIDAEILRLYDLPPKFERQLLDLFWGEKRRVPIDFFGYIPPEYESWIPLHIYISQNFRKTNAQAIMKAIPNNCSPETVQFFQSLIENNNDE